MSIVNGVWHDAKQDPPARAHVNKTVLIVKANKNGDRSIAFGAYMNCGSLYSWTTNNGKGEVLYWMPLPKIPED